MRLLWLLRGNVPGQCAGNDEDVRILTHDNRTLLFDKKRLYDIGERHLDDAKKYLYAHGQEKEGQEVGNTGTFSRSR